MRKQLIGCECGLFYHSILLSSVGADIEDYFVDIHLCQFYSIWGRLKIAISFLCNKETSDGLFDASAICHSDCLDLVAFLTCATLEIDEQAIECSLVNDRYRLVFRLETFEGSFFGLFPTFSAVVEFNRRPSLSGRLWQAFRYVLGYKSPFGGDQFQMSQEAAKALRGMAISHYSLSKKQGKHDNEN